MNSNIASEVPIVGTTTMATDSFGYNVNNQVDSGPIVGSTGAPRTPTCLMGVSAWTPILLPALATMTPYLVLDIDYCLDQRLWFPAKRSDYLMAPTPTVSVRQ